MHAEALTPSERYKLMRDGLINNLSFLVSGIVGIVLVPLMLKWLGAEAYGIWIVAIVTTTILSTLDFGLYPTVLREVSSYLGSGREEEVWSVLEGAGNAYLLLGVAGALLLVILGYAFSDHLHLDLQSRRTVWAVFGLVGMSFCLDLLSFYSSTVLVGLRRFAHANLIRSSVAVFRAAGMVALLAMGGRLLSIALWQVVTATVSLGLNQTVVRHLVPKYHFRVGRLHGRDLRQRFSFAASSLLSTVFGGLPWQSGSLLIGFMQGSAAVVPFYVGIKFPLAAASFGWRTAETLFPAASESQDNLSRTRETLRVGTRWVLVLMLPVVTLFWIVGPNLLTVWVGTFDPEALRVLRLMGLAALADAFLAASLNILWGRASMRIVLPVLSGVAAGTVGLAVMLIPSMAGTGAAWGALLPLVGGAIIIFYRACRECEAEVTQMTRSLFRGLVVPVAGCAAGAYLITAVIGTGLWPLVEACMTGSAAYAFLLYIAPGQNEERRFLQDAFRRVMPSL